MKYQSPLVPVTLLFVVSVLANSPTPPPISGAGGWADAAAKAKAFIKDLTIDEKVNLTTGVDTLGRCVGNTGMLPRISFPGFCLQDSPAGVRETDFNSVFPAGVNIAATFDKGLMFKRGEAMGREFRGKGINVALGPMMNLARNAAAGRNWEGGGADPFLSGVHAAQNVKGIQSKGVIACAKHFIMNDQEHYRGGSGAEAYSSNASPQTIHETSLWPFAESVHAGVGSVMCAYNRVDQIGSCENAELISGILKGELGFQGFVVSDWAAIDDEGGAGPWMSVGAGVDVNMPGFFAYIDASVGPQGDQGDPSQATNTYWGKALGDAVRNGSISMDTGFFFKSAPALGTAG